MRRTTEDRIIGEGAAGAIGAGIDGMVRLGSTELLCTGAGAAIGATGAATEAIGAATGATIGATTGVGAATEATGAGAGAGGAGAGAAGAAMDGTGCAGVFSSLFEAKLS